MPGSLADLAIFARFCRARLDHAVATGEAPAFLCADGPDFADAVVNGWHLDGAPPATEELLAGVVPAWLRETEASQVAVSVPFGGECPGVTLVAVDEAESLIEQSYLDVVRLRLGDWQVVPVDLDVFAWQRELAQNAGYTDFAKWRCRACQSVCGGEAAEVPTPCAFCGSEAIEPVELSTPLCPPDHAFAPRPFAVDLLELIERQTRPADDD
jgi:hypothetical protein